VQDNNLLIFDWCSNKVFSVAERLQSVANIRTHAVRTNLKKILNAYNKARLGTYHFSSLTGYAHDDQGRDVIDRIFADIFRCEKAAVRQQFVSGTHAISSALFGVLRPGDSLLSVTGKPYETLEEVIGIRGTGQGSLKEFGVLYEELPFASNNQFDFAALQNALSIPRKMVFIQRSCGYSWRAALSIELIQKICFEVHKKQPNCVCFVDNCYGEFVEEKEPTEVGADLIAGSLIKNPGGTIVPSGGYIAGRSSLVEQSCCRLTAPGIGSKSGSGFDLNRIVLQGLFLAPQMVAEALIGADLVAGVFQEFGFKVLPLPGESRSDVIQAVQIGDPEALKLICRVFQSVSPVGSYLDPVPSSMPGYENDLVMAGGTFIDGSTSEFSADAPLKPPFNLFVQGGTHRCHVELALINVLCELIKAGFIKTPQNR
tara:strand:+ start:785 stop:2068 length:1284 start_codon:yes stop_codon:yes gene_type:complete